MAAQLMARNGRSCRALYWWMACATSSLPEPLSPVIMTAASLFEMRPTILNTSCMAGD